MPARVCDNCTIKYPHLITECRACGNVLKYVSFQSPDYDWEERAERAGAAGAPPAIPQLKCCSVKDKDGRRWLYNVDLRQSGWIGDVGSFDLFETADGIIEVQGFDSPRRRWWVEVVS